MRRASLQSHYWPLMSKNSAANVNLVVVLLAWPLMFFGIAQQMGDPAPPVSSATIEATHHFAQAVLLGGALSLFAAIGLALYAVRAAKVRAGIMFTIGAIPVLIAVAMAIVALGASTR